MNLRLSKVLPTLALLVASAIGAQAQTTFSNNTPIAVPGTGTVGVSNPYPSTINVTGMSGSIDEVSVTITNFTHTWPSDVDFLLVGPGGQTLIFCSDAIGGNGGIIGRTYTFKDSAATVMPAAGFPESGEFQPANYGANDPFATPAPGGPYGNAQTGGSDTFTSVFAGTAPNGTWSLYVVDDASGDIGSIDGWSLTVAAGGDPASVTSLVSSLNPSNTGDNVTFTATATVNGSPVSTGTVTFKEGANVLSGPTNVNANGQASFSTNSLSIGAHVITAEYSGSTGVARGSSANLRQIVNGPGCNFGGITILDDQVANPYPSEIVISGVSGTVSNATVQLLGFSHTFPDDCRIRLEAPSGQTVVLMTGAGGGLDIVNVDLTFDDAASNGPIPDATQIESGSYAPGQYVADYIFPTPAPQDNYGTSMSALNGATANGTWKLYVVDDAGIDVGSITGWCLNVQGGGGGGGSTFGPNNYQIVKGEEFDGGLSTLLESDDVRLTLFNDATDLSAQVIFFGTSSNFVPTSMTFKAEMSVARPGLQHQIHQFNFNTNQYDAVVGAVSSSTDTVYEVTLTTTALAHVNSDTGAVRARVTWSPINDEDPSQDGWLHAVDQVSWTVSN